MSDANNEDDYPFALSRLPHTELDMTFCDLGAVRTDSASDGALEIECRFIMRHGTDYRGREVQSHETIWLPLTDLAFLTPLGRYRRRRPIGVEKQAERRRLRDYRPLEICDLVDNGEEVWQRNTTQADESSLTLKRLDRPYVFDRAPERTYLPSGEIFRFYFGGMSLLADRLLSAWEIDDPAAGVFDADRTFLDEETSTFHIAPTWDFADQGSVLLLSLLLASPDVMTAWRSVRQSLMAARFSGHPAYPICWTRPDPAPISVTGHPSKCFDETGQFRQMFRVSRLVSDHRPAPFKEICVHLDHAMATQLQEDGEIQAIERGVKLRKLLIDSQMRPGGRTIKTAGQVSTLLRSFPNLDDVFVRYEQVERTRPQRVIGPAQVSYELGSTAERGSSEPEVAKLVLRPTRGTRRPPPAGGEALLFQDFGFDFPEPCAVDVGGLGFPLRQFVTAAQTLEWRGHGRLIDAARGEPGQATIWRLPASWGKASHQTAGRPLHAAVISLRLGRVTALALELERHRPTLGTTIGVFTSTTGLPLNQVHAAAILRHAVRRRVTASTVEQERGFWPSPAQFADIAFMPLLHLQRRRNAAILADAITDALERMLDGTVEAHAASTPY
jgi:hypothetical protein